MMDLTFTLDNILKQMDFYVTNLKLAGTSEEKAYFEQKIYFLGNLHQALTPFELEEEVKE